MNSWELERKFERCFMEWVKKHDVEHAITFCDGWDPTRARRNGSDFWKVSEEDRQRLHSFATQMRKTSSTVARNCQAQKLPVLTCIKLPGKKRSGTTVEIQG